MTLTIPDILTIQPAVLGNNATLSYQSTVDCIANTGIITITRIGR